MVLKDSKDIICWVDLLLGLTKTISNGTSVCNVKTTSRILFGSDPLRYTPDAALCGSSYVLAGEGNGQLDVKEQWQAACAAARFDEYTSWNSDLYRVYEDMSFPENFQAQWGMIMVEVEAKGLELSRGLLINDVQ
jgi:hypothetical protein